MQIRPTAWRRLLALTFILVAIPSCGEPTEEIPASGRETSQEEMARAAAEQRALEDLRTLPYLSHSRHKADATKRGVTLHDRARAFDGYTLLDHKIIDMEGKVVNEWPGLHLTLLLDDGDIISRSRTHHVTRVSWAGETIWKHADVKIHHEVTLTQKGSVLVASRETHEYQGRKVEFDTIVELSLDGVVIDRWSTYENLEYLQRFHSASKLDQPSSVDIPVFKNYRDGRSVFGGDYDYYHLNSIQVIPDTPLGQKDQRFRPGNLLISLPYFDLVAVLEQNTWQVLWTWGPGEIELQHDPRLLPNGNILVFDNGKRRKWTRAVEMNPVDGSIAWQYRGDPEESFFSATRGSTQRLPNGNTLIAESDNGRVIEVTKQGDIVWEWHNPSINNEGKRAAVYRARRIDRTRIDAILESVAEKR